MEISTVITTEIFIFLIPVFLIVVLYFLLKRLQKMLVDKDAKSLEKILSKIIKENPNISKEELLRRIKFEYELERQKHPELTQLELGDLEGPTLAKRNAKVKVVKMPLKTFKSEPLLWKLIKNLFK